jgi:acetoin utilization protein AcuB
MTRPALTIRPEEVVDAAWRLMRGRNVRHLPVVDASGRLVGIVTDRDLRQAVFGASTRARLPEHGGSVASLPVDRVMTRAALSVRPDAEIRQAARLMAERKIGALPVVQDDGVVIGILTETDVLRAFVDVIGQRALPASLRWLVERASQHDENVRRRAERFVG